MEKAKYDIFISYRREGGDKYARTIQQALEKQYRVFLDFDELKDGVFDQRIIDAISESPVFLLILSKGALDRCVNEDDWVRQEILQAVKSGCHIVPVTIVEDDFEGVPSNLPDELQHAVGQHQFSELQMKTLFKASMEQLISDRIEPYMHHETTNEIQNGKFEGKEDVSFGDVNKVLTSIHRWGRVKIKEISITWKKRNLATNVIACIYLFPLLLLLFIYIEVLTHRYHEFTDLSSGYYVVTFLYGLLQYFLNRRDGFYIILLSPIIVLSIGYLQFQSNQMHIYDSTMLMYMSSIPLLLSLLLKKKGKSTWSHLQGGLWGLLKWKRHFFYYLWCVAWIVIAVYKIRSY